MSIRIRRRIHGRVVVALALWVGGTASAELPRQPVLPLELAQRMVQACVDMSGQRGWNMHIAIKDRGDNLITYARMDNTALGAGSIAMQKASASARMPWSTSMLGRMAFNPETGNPTGLAFVEGNILFGGGLPIMTADGHHLGGIGVSGGSPQQDEECAQAGIDAVAEELR
jgi:glc operon protein GlcG